jgi:hypothetical protein
VPHVTIHRTLSRRYAPPACHRLSIRACSSMPPPPRPRRPGRLRGERSPRWPREPRSARSCKALAGRDVESNPPTSAFDPRDTQPAHVTPTEQRAVRRWEPRPQLERRRRSFRRCPPRRPRPPTASARSTPHLPADARSSSTAQGLDHLGPSCRSAARVTFARERHRRPATASSGCRERRAVPAELAVQVVEPSLTACGPGPAALPTSLEERPGGTRSRVGVVTEPRV